MTVEILRGDVRDVLPTLASDSFDCVVTSPPYWGLRDYGVEGQIGLEPTMQGYLDTMVGVCREVRRVLKPEGTFWLNIGDSYANTGNTQTDFSASKVGYGGSGRGKIGGQPKKQIPKGLKPKDLCMIPNRLAILLQEDGWYVRSEIIWHKPNPMPESVRDRPTSAHEKVWLLTKSPKYYYDADAIAEDGVGRERYFGSDNYSKGSGRNDAGSYNAEPCVKRNARNVWSISPKPFKGAHFATMPPDLVERCIKAGCPEGGLVLDPFGGSGTTGMVAQQLQRNATLIELNEEYTHIINSRIGML
jgi:DNA modification methylase